ncbi:aminotransferase class IV family protein [Fulvivirgaceae bacterium BMA10]|uniref:Aminotransferase class IV family protein n=1 Tax=Splendidivirga corallicola TaxID=3051826 RepID=A0ABT8KIN5_9BACT|nr:aminotransferase class IV family protein [Fulvivirgaceae bacterium BMA10]
MCRLIETIKISNRTIHHLPYHTRRMHTSRSSLFNCKDFLDLEKIIHLPEWLTDNVYKCRIIYSQTIEKIEFEPYRKKEIQTLKLVHDDTIEYKFKYQNRQSINTLFELKENCDDILIVKNGYITDTSYCNIAFNDGRIWLTPTTPLLKGTMREQLLEQDKIKEKEITLDSLRQFKVFKLMNAMIGFDGPEVEVSNIVK